jgi:D-alanyl-D-alanine carboxypeptidase
MRSPGRPLHPSDGRSLHFRPFIAALALSLAGPASGESRASRSTEATAREITDYAESHHFSGGILVEDGGAVILRKAFGLANRVFGIPNRVDTLFKQASITKLFTSALILQLVDQRRIDLRQPIRSYLPSYAGEAATRVSVHQLLTATSGIEAFGKGTDDPYTTRYTSDQLLDMFCSGPLIHEPGTVFNYNNADYVILGKIVEAVAGKPYDAVLNDMILARLGLKNTGVLGDEVVRGLAESYLWDEKAGVARWEPPYAIANYYAAGAMYSTLDDLRVFSDALFGGRLLQPGTLDTLLTPSRARYASGLWVYEYEVNGKTVRVAERQGAIEGTNNRLVRLLDRDLTIILLTNMDGTDLDAMQRWIIGELVRGRPVMSRLPR